MVENMENCPYLCVALFCFCVVVVEEGKQRVCVCVRMSNDDGAGASVTEVTKPAEPQQFKCENCCLCGSVCEYACV